VLALVSGRLDLDPASDLFHGGAGAPSSSPRGADAGARDRLAAVADVVVAAMMLSTWRLRSTPWPNEG
jgi:hypothetical protein